MDEMPRLDAPELVEAVRLWTDWGPCYYFPRRDERRVIDRFGEVRAASLMAVIRRLDDDFYATDAYLRAASLQEVGELAAADFKAKHPTVADDIVTCLTWCYTYDYK